MNLFYFSLRAIAKVYFSLLYRNKVYGLEHVPKGGAILAPNHISFYDPTIVAVSCPEELHFLADAYLFDIFFMGWMMRHLNAYSIAEHGRTHSSMKNLCRHLQQGEKVLIFPEGRRAYDGKLGTIKLGVPMLSLRANIPIIPIYIHGAYEAWPRFRKLPKLSGRTACVFGSPIYPDRYLSLEPREGRKALGADLHKALMSLWNWYQKGAGGTPP